MYYNRFDGKHPLPELYEELKLALDAETPVADSVAVKNLQLDLANDTVTYNDKSRPLGERAKSVLCERLGLGRIYDVLPKEVLETVQPYINEALRSADESLILKSRGGIVQGVVSDRYREIPYVETMEMMENLGARPIRVYQNDYNLRVQAIFDDHRVTPVDGEPINLGVQLRTSDMGVGALAFDVYTYRWICKNGCIMGKKSVGSFRTVHVQSIKQAKKDTRREVTRVLGQAKIALEGMIGQLAGIEFNRDKVVHFLAKQAIGKRALATLSSRIVEAEARTMWDVVNVLTRAGHDDSFSLSIQQELEKSAGLLMEAAVA